MEIYCIGAIFCGPSSCGKANTLLSLITHPNVLGFVNLYSKFLIQPKYEILNKVIEPLKGLQSFAYSEHDDVIFFRQSSSRLNNNF